MACVGLVDCKGVASLDEDDRGVLVGGPGGATEDDVDDEEEVETF